MNDLLWASLGLGCAFGVAARISDFCLLGGLRQMMSSGRQRAGRGGMPVLQAFALALVAALIGTQGLALLGLIDLSQALPVRARFSPPGTVAGGMLFGIGMALARSCGARALVLLAGGNLRSLWVLLWLGLGAQASMTGALAPWRQTLQGWMPVTLAQPTAHGWLAAQWGEQGFSPMLALALAAGLPCLLLLIFALRAPRPDVPALRRQWPRLLGSLLIGTLVAAGWWTSTALADPFAPEPQPITSLSFISPVAESWLWLQLAVGRELAAGVMLVAGVLVGAFAAALVSRTLRLEGFESPGRMAGTAIGGLLMGFGGVVTLGCTIGQGLSGLSTLSLASLLSVSGIVLGAIIVIPWQKP